MNITMKKLRFPESGKPWFCENWLFYVVKLPFFKNDLPKTSRYLAKTVCILYNFKPYIFRGKCQTFAEIARYARFWPPKLDGLVIFTK